MDEKQSTLFSGNISHEGSQCAATLTKNALYWTKPNQDSVFKVEISDVIGAMMHPKDPLALLIHTCPLVKNKRERKTHWFVCESQQTAKKWITSFRALLAGVSLERLDLVKPKRYLVFYNRFKDSDEVFLEVVKPMLEAANIKVTLIDILRYGHVKDYATSLSERYDAVLCVGSNDILDEYITGIMYKSDSSSFLEVPVAIVPTAPGHVLASSLGATDPVSATYYAIKGTPYPLDVFSILKGSATRLGSSSVLQTSRRTYGTSYVAWGIENLDFTTDNSFERPFKFAVSAIKTLVDAKKFTGRITLLPENAPRRMCGAKCKYCQRPTGDLVPAKVEEEVPSPKQEELKSTTSKVDWKRTALATQQIVENMIQETVKKQEKVVEVEEEVEEEVVEIDLNSSPKVERVETPEIIDTNFWKEDDPFFSVQSNRWKVIEPEFMLFIASKSFTLGGDTLPCPWAHMSDGFLDVVVVRKVTNSNLVKILSAIQRGTHSNFEGVEYHKVRALKLEPTSEGSIVADGEEVSPYGPIRIEVHRGLINVLCCGYQTPQVLPTTLVATRSP